MDSASTAGARASAGGVPGTPSSVVANCGSVTAAGDAPSALKAVTRT